MLIVKIIYLALLIGLAIFSVLYIDSFAVILLLCMLILPVLLLLSLLLARCSCRAELLCSTPVTASKETIPLTVSVVSRCPLPFPCTYITLKVRHAFGCEPEIMQMRFPLRGRNTTRMTFYIHADCCGTVDVTLHKIHIYDYLRLFRTGIPVTERTQHITVLPKRIPVPYENSASPTYCEDSEVYADIAGDDPSEISNLKEYAPGDPISRIHWKLSSKSDRLIIKEFGMPVRKSVLLAVEYISPGRKNSIAVMQQAETLLSIAYSLSCELIEAGIPHEIAWFSAGQNTLMRQSPENSADLTEIFCTMFLSVGNMPLPVTSLQQNGNTCSSIICLSNHADPALPTALEQEFSVSRKTVIFTADHLSADFSSAHSVSLIQVQPDSVIQNLPLLVI